MNLNYIQKKRGGWKDMDGETFQEDDDMMEVLDYDNQETEDVVALLFS